MNRPADFLFLQDHNIAGSLKTKFKSANIDLLESKNTLYIQPTDHAIKTSITLLVFVAIPGKSHDTNLVTIIS